jgi:hypothetical protein
MISKPASMKTKPNVLALILSTLLQSEILEFIYKNSGSQKPYKAITCTQQKLASTPFSDAKVYFFSASP